MTVQIHCPIPEGDEIHLVAMIHNNTPGGSEYWINKTFAIDPRDRQPQSFTSTVSAGVTRTYFLIATTAAHLHAIETAPGNLQPDGSGYRSLGDLSPISNQAVNTEIPQ